MTKLSIEKVKNAIPGTKGIILNIAKNCQVDNKTLHTFLNKHPKLREDIEIERSKVVDIAEDALYEKLKQKDMKAIQMVLQSKKAEDRGFYHVSEQKTTDETSLKNMISKVDKVRSIDKKQKEALKEVLWGGSS